MLDSELDVDHTFFRQIPHNPKYSKEDIAQFISQEGMHEGLMIEEVYRSAKIPFAYDYALNWK